MKQNNTKVSFRVIYKKPLKVKTLKEYNKSKQKSLLKKKIILKDTGEGILNANNSRK